MPIFDDEALELLWQINNSLISLKARKQQEELDESMKATREETKRTIQRLEQTKKMIERKKNLQ